MEILTKENLVGSAPTAIARTSAPRVKESGFLTKDSLLPPRIRRKIIRRWGWESNRDPELGLS